MRIVDKSLFVSIALKNGDISFLYEPGAHWPVVICNNQSLPDFLVCVSGYHTIYARQVLYH